VSDKGTRLAHHAYVYLHIFTSSSFTRIYMSISSPFTRIYILFLLPSLAFASSSFFLHSHVYLPPPLTHHADLYCLPLLAGICQNMYCSFRKRTSKYKTLSAKEPYNHIMRMCIFVPSRADMCSTKEP